MTMEGCHKLGRNDWQQIFLEHIWQCECASAFQDHVILLLRRIRVLLVSSKLQQVPSLVNNMQLKWPVDKLLPYR